jgi:hypothetical protein
LLTSDRANISVNILDIIGHLTIDKELIIQHSINNEIQRRDPSPNDTPSTKEKTTDILSTRKFFMTRVPLTVLATAANIEDQIFQCQNCIHRMVSALLMKNASTNHIVYGRSHATSRDFMWQSLSKLFARLHMLKLPETIVDGNVGQEYVDKIIELLYRATIIEEFVSNATLIGTKHNLDNRPDAGIYTPSISLKVVLDAVVCFTYVRPDSFLLLRTSL